MCGLNSNVEINITVQLHFVWKRSVTQRLTGPCVMDRDVEGLISYTYSTKVRAFHIFWIQTYL